MDTLLSRQVVLDDGHHVGVTTGGTGTPLVFFHGFTANRRLYHPLLAYLTQRGFAVTAIDMAGHGTTDPLHRGHTFADMRDLAIRTLDQLGIDQAIMAGHSLGGRMVTEIAATHPHRVTHAVLINAAVGRHFDELRVTPAVVAKLPATFAGAVVDVLSDIPWHRPGRSLRYLRHLADGMRPSLIGVWQVGAATHTPTPTTVDLLAVMRRNAVPLTVIHSAWDLIAPFGNGARVARTSGATLVAVPGAHNWIMARPRFAAEVVAVAAA